jgi:Flp pilus assembly protein CpaB
VAAVAAVLIGISAARPPEPPSVDVLRAVREIAAGSTLSAGDIRTDRIPVSAAPVSPLADSALAVGRTAAGTIGDGQVLTETDLGTPRAGHGKVIAPFRLADAQVAQLLRVGDRVDVIAAGRSDGKAQVIAGDVTVVGLPHPADDGGLGGGDSGGQLVLVEVDLTTATTLNDVAAAGRLSVALR